MSYQCHLNHRLLLLAATWLLLTSLPLLSAQETPAETPAECSSAGQLETPAALALPLFKDGEAQIFDGFENEQDWIRHDLWVETEFDSDGDLKLDRMHVAVTRPKQTDSEQLKLPVVYETSPYYAGTAASSPAYMWDPRQELGSTPATHRIPDHPYAPGKRPVISNSQVKEWLPRGYIVVHSSSPGTGLSQGCPTVGGSNESLAPKAVIDWLCGRAPGYTQVDGNETVAAYWCSGKIGMTGTSYNGTLPLAAATTGVAGLEAIIPVAPNTSYYHYYRSNGLVRHPGGYIGEDIDVLYEFIYSGTPTRRDYCDCSVRDTLMLANLDRATGDSNDFWQTRDYLAAMPNMKAALLMSHAFNDWNVMPEHSVRIYEAAKRQGLPVQVYFHQEGHGGPPPLSMMNRWFTYFLHGVDNDVLEQPRAWIVREGEARDKPAAYEDYPNPAARQVTFFLAPGGQRRGGLSALPTIGPAGTETLVDNYSFNGQALAQADWTEHRLLYVTPTLTSPVHLSGHSELRIRLACDRPAANLSVWLVSLPWNENAGAPITDNIVTRGWADPQNHGGRTQGVPLEPGRFYDLHFELQPDDQVIAAGQQLGLMIFSSDREFTLHPEPGTQLTIDLDTTTLTLPIVGGSSAWELATQHPPTPAPTRNAKR